MKQSNTRCIFKPTCPEIYCKDHRECEKCGWNPEVEKIRHEKVRNNMFKETIVFSESMQQYIVVKSI